MCLVKNENENMQKVEVCVKQMDLHAYVEWDDLRFTKGFNQVVNCQTENMIFIDFYNLHYKKIFLLKNAEQFHIQTTYLKQRLENNK